MQSMPGDTCNHMNRVSDNRIENRVSDRKDLLWRQI